MSSEQAPARVANAYGAARAWSTFFILQVQILLIGIDLGIVTLLVKPIESGLKIDDVTFASITATPVAIGIAVAYYPSGLLADTFRRRDMIALGAAVWLVAALIASRSGSAPMMFVARLIAGTGTGVAGPSVFSLLTDAFSRERRAFATSAFTSGLAVGGGLGLASCGALVASAERRGTVRALGMAFEPWQQCFVAVAALGVLAIALVLTVREPARRERVRPQHEANMGASFAAFLAYMRRHAFLWTALLVGFAAATTCSIGLQAWAPTFGMRRYGGSMMSLVGLLGSFSAAGALAGSILGGLLAQRLINVGKSHLLPRMLAVVAVLTSVFATTFPFMPTWPLAVAVIGLLGTTVAMLSVLIPVGIQETVPNEVRGQIVGLNGILGFIPSLAGATLVAYLAAHAFAGRGGLGPAFATVGAVTGGIAIVLFVLCAKPYRRALAEIRKVL